MRILGIAGGGGGGMGEAYSSGVNRYANGGGAGGSGFIILKVVG